MRALLYSFEEQAAVEELVRILAPIKDITVIFSQDSLPTMPMIIPSLLKLKVHLTPKDEDTNLIEKVKQAMSEDLEKKIYKGQCSQLASPS